MEEYINDSMVTRIEKNESNITSIFEKNEGHSNLIKSNSDLISELQVIVAKVENSLKYKLDGEEIDSLNVLMNELYERILTIENHTINKDGSHPALND